MADVYLTLTELENLFWNNTALMLSLDPSLATTSEIVKISWPTAGTPAWEITEDRVFIRVGEKDDDYNILRDIAYTEQDSATATESTAQTRVVHVHWVCYGPNAYDNAFTIRRNLYNSAYREKLAVSYIYVIPQIATPIRQPELFASQWWERTDIEADFNELVKFEQDVAYLQTATISASSETKTLTDNVTSSSLVHD